MRWNTPNIRPNLPKRKAASGSPLIREVALEIGKAGTRFPRTTGAAQPARQPRRLGSGPLPAFPQRAHRLRGHRRRHQPNTWNKFHPKFFDQPPAQKFWNELHFPKEYPLAFFEMSLPAAALPQGQTRAARHLFHPGVQPRVDLPRRFHVDGSPQRRGSRRLATSPSRPPGAKRPILPTTCCRWATPPSATT
jgi:hypothetical protein